MADGTVPITGAARKARERRARASAKHVQWLASNFQLLASHHTRPTKAGAGNDELAELRSEVEQLKAELCSLKTELRSCAGGGAAADTAAGPEALVMRAEARAEQETTDPAVAADTTAGSEPAVMRAEAAGVVTKGKGQGPKPIAREELHSQVKLCAPPPEAAAAKGSLREEGEFGNKASLRALKRLSKPLARPHLQTDPWPVLDSPPSTGTVMSKVERIAEHVLNQLHVGDDSSMRQELVDLMKQQVSQSAEQLTGASSGDG